MNKLAPIKRDDKKAVLGPSGINMLMPLKYKWAWEWFLLANRNTWFPTEINMNKDVEQYHQELTDAEKHVFENVLAYLTTADILAMRNVGIAFMEKMTAPELQIYQAVQTFQEAIHSWAYQFALETLNMDQDEIYNRHRVIPEIAVKIQLTEQYMQPVYDPVLREEALPEFLLAYFFFAGVFEGAWFYNGFSPIFALHRRGLMRGTAEQLQYIMRDEALHAQFGLTVVKTIMQETNTKLDPVVVREMFEQCEDAEEQYIKYILRDPILGYNVDDHMEQFRYLCNRRARSVGLPEPYHGARKALSWLDEMAHIRKEKNFFETRVTEYQVGGLVWD